MEPKRLDGTSHCICGNHRTTTQHTRPCQIYRHVTAHLRAAGEEDPMNILQACYARLSVTSTA